MQTTDEFLSRCNALMDGQTPQQILTKALHKIRSPNAWAQNAVARDIDGKRVRANSPYAVAWDVEGAIAVSSNSFGILPPYFMVLLDQVAEEKFGYVYGANSFNDHCSHESVIELLTAALVLATEERDGNGR